jgi:hypothetical protein
MVFGPEVNVVSAQVIPIHRQDGLRAPDRHLNEGDEQVVAVLLDIMPVSRHALNSEVILFLARNFGDSVLV